MATRKKYQNSGTLLMTVMLLIMCPNFSGYAQKINGYIVKNDGERIECHVLNTGNEEATTFYEYILPGNTKSQKMDLATIKEFGIGNDQKFIRELIQIDASSDRIKRAEDAEKGPEIQEGHGYLRVLYEGQRASLYSYYDEGRTFFYYKKRESDITLLYYKQYEVEVATGVIQNIIIDNTYKEQLSTAFEPEDPKMITKLSYTKKSLTRFFETVNQAEAGSSPILYKKISQGYFRANVSGALNINSYRVRNLEFSQMIVFSQEPSFTYGLEFEYIFPHNKHRWGLFLGAYHSSYQSDKASKIGENNLTDFEINYKAFDFPLGISWNVPIFKNCNIFSKVGFVPQIITESSYVTLGAEYHYPFESVGSAVFAAGIRMGRFSAEYRYYSNKNITQNLYNRESRLSQSTILVGVSLFQTKKNRKMSIDNQY